MSLARDALASGDMVTAESYLQHAEHYNRIIMAAQSQAAAAAPQSGDPQQANGNVTRGRQNDDDDAEEDDEAEAVGEPDAPAEVRGRGRGRQRRNGAHTASEASGAEQPIEAGAADGAEGAPEAVG